MQIDPVIREWLRLAGQAPSSHNTQPWRFRVDRAGVEVWTDPTRSLPVNDPTGRERIISCGCAVLNLRVAAAADGQGLNVRPEQAGDGPFVRLLTGHHGGAGQQDLAPLREWIGERRSWRGRFLTGEISPDIVETLVHAARQEGAWLRPITGDERREEVANLIRAATAAQWKNPAWRRELAQWMRPASRGDGLPVGRVTGGLARWSVRHLVPARAMARGEARAARAAPLLLALGTGIEGPMQWLTAGQALQRVLLEAARHGLCARYLNQPVQQADWRPQLAETLGGGQPQLLFALGLPDGTSHPTPRRPLDDLLKH
ncbi:nitroreductase family protein [Thioalkalivibrio sp. ALgr1]|uniref:Acg family FMN-binding oxidoreductase n=1 Tax=Thioalkalivibrio sp. ALgr1 TaxID=748655 RepID=UPI00037E91B2|nr:nitroreductase family protein [Thioalkalivibrio sp. ALgr1]